MSTPRFTLTVAATRDGFIARAPGHAPFDWVSTEEQALFFRDVEAADWSIMGRGTHEAAPRADRRRIVFSAARAGWQSDRQLWLDPEGLTPADLARKVEHVHPLRDGLILGGTRVHDWFLSHDAIDRVHLTVEPITWGAGLPVFSGAALRDPIETFRAKGFIETRRAVLNEGGALWIAFARAPAATDPALPGH